jgi:hypothetical protein
MGGFCFFFCQNELGNNLGGKITNLWRVKANRNKKFFGNRHVVLLFWRENRVARLGDFSPIGRLFSLRVVFSYKITKVAQTFGLILPTKIWVGLHLGRFFTNSSSHPARTVRFRQFFLQRLCRANLNE